ncbi:hypothetical protein [Mammaliicoccus sciuri]|nr:hypothetical protein [Mammaliicoccus sciuri]
MNFKNGDRVRVTKFCWEDVDFYATLQETNSFLGRPLYRLVNCTNFDYQNYLVRKENSDLYGVRDYYTLAAEQEDSEEPVINYIHDMYNEVPTKYVVEVQGSYVNDIHLRGSTKMGGYWGSYTPDNEKLDIRNVWITDDYRKALGIAYLVNGEVQKFKE